MQGFNAFDVVTLPFPFADRNDSVVRPALVLSEHASFGSLSGVALVAMITSANRSAWPFDVAIAELECAGLKMPCRIRLKINAVDCALIDRKIGILGAHDRDRVSEALRGVFGEVLGQAS